MGQRIEPRLIMTHLDWLTLRGVGEFGKRGAELLKTLRDTLNLSSKEKSFAGYSGGWYYEQFTDRGIRISTTDEAEMKLELQGLFWNGVYQDPFLKMIELANKLKNIEKVDWRLTRVDVAKDLFGVSVAEAFPSPKKADWDFPFEYTEHQQKAKDEKMVYTGFTARKQRWSLTVYDKKFEIENVHTHKIKQLHFEKFAKKGEAITRVELRIKSGEGLAHMQGFLQTSVNEAEFCQTILKHWADYHRIKTKIGNDEYRFRKLLRSFDKRKLAREKKTRLVALYDDYRAIRINDLARQLVRDGLADGKSFPELLEILEVQYKWLIDEMNISQIKTTLAGQQPKGDR